MELNAQTNQILSLSAELDGELKMNGIFVGVDHPCYLQVKQIIDQYREKDKIIAGDICILADVDEVYITRIDNYRNQADGFYLSGLNKGQIGSFKLGYLKKTGKHIGIDKFLAYYSD